MSRDRYFALGIGGFVFGVLFHSFFDFGIAFSGFVLALSASLFLYVRKDPDRAPFFATPSDGHRFLRGPIRRREAPPTVVVFCALLFIFGLGLLRYDLALPRDSLLLETGAAQTIEGVLADEPDLRDIQQRLVLRVEDGVGRNTQVLIFAPLTPLYVYGDRLSVRGRLAEPENFADDFDWVGFLAKDDIYYQMFLPTIRLVASDEGHPVKSALFRLKHAFQDRIGRVIPEPAAAYLGGLLLGTRSSLGKEMQEQFRRAGVSHVVALSGYNMTIVAENITRVARAIFTPRIGAGLGVIGIVLFSIMTGAGATVVRAAVMALIAVVARASGRPYAMGRALLLAGFLMVFHDPRILVFDISFQLSFVATLGILYGPPILEPYLQWVTTKSDIRGTIATTISAQVAVLPLILYKMGALSLVALPVNLLILPIIPATMFAGFFAGAIGFLSSVLSLPFAYASYLMLEYQLSIIGFFSELPFSEVEFFLPLFVALALYFALGWGVWRWTQKHKTETASTRTTRSR